MKAIKYYKIFLKILKKFCSVCNIFPDTRAVITAELVLGAGGEGEVGEVAGLCGAVPGVIEDLPGVSPNTQAPSWRPADSKKIRVPGTLQPPGGGWLVKPRQGGRDCFPRISDNRQLTKYRLNPLRYTEIGLQCGTSNRYFL